MYTLCANLFTQRRIAAKENRLREAKSILKEKAGIFSNFRGMTQLSTICMLAMEEQPDMVLDKMMTAYQVLKEEFGGNSYLVLAAQILSSFVPVEDYGKIAVKAKAFYKQMKKLHPFLTGQEDITYTVLFAVSELEESYLMQEVERCYELLKPHFNSRNALQSLSHVLALGEGSAKVKCRRTVELYEKLKDKGCRYSTGYELATLGALALSEQELDAMVDDICEADSYLKNQKGFGFLGYSAKQRLMYAGMITMGLEAGTQDMSKLDISSMTGTISVILAQEAAVCASMMAASAAASASAAT